MAAEFMKLQKVIETKLKCDVTTPRICSMACGQFVDSVDIAIADSDNKCVKLFDMKDGNHKWMYSTEGAVPCSVAWLNSEEIAVSIEHSSSLLVLSSTNGDFLCPLNAYISCDNPGLTMNGDKMIITEVSFSSTNNLKVISTYGSFLQSIKLDDNDEMKPRFIHVTKHDMIVITYWGKNVVKTFTMEGRNIFTSGSDDDKEKFNSPCGLCSDHNGDILVADNWNDRIVHIDHKSQKVKTILSKHDGIRSPKLLAMMSSGELLVKEDGSSQIKLFH